MASNKDKVDLSGLNNSKKQTRNQKMKNPLKKQKGPARDNEGKFTSGSGGLRQINFNWKRALPVVLIVALAGGFLVYRGLAKPSTGYSHEQLNTALSVSVGKVKETRSSKRNAQVVEIANASGATNAKAVFDREVEPDTWKACVMGVAQRGTPRISVVASAQSTTLGSSTFTASSTQEYRELGCIQVNHTGEGHSGKRLRFTVNNQTANTAFRVSTILLERTTGEEPVPEPTKPYPKVVSVAGGSIKSGESQADACVRMMNNGFTGCVFYVPQGRRFGWNQTGAGKQLADLAKKVGDRAVDIQLTPKTHNDEDLESILKNLPEAWKPGFIYNIWQEPQDNAFKKDTNEPLDLAVYRKSYTDAAKITRKYGVSLPWLEWMEWPLDPNFQKNNPSWDHTKLLPPSEDFAGILWSLFEFNENGRHNDNIEKRTRDIKAAMDKYAPGKPWGLMAGGYSLKQGATLNDAGYRAQADWFYKYYNHTKANGSRVFGWFDASSQYDPVSAKQSGELLIEKNPYIAKPLNLPN